jgi:diguanylate cyclase (GGDEF)-like protein
VARPHGVEGNEPSCEPPLNVTLPLPDTLCTLLALRTPRASSNRAVSGVGAHGKGQQLLASWEKTISGLFGLLRLGNVKSRMVAFALLATLIPSVSTAWIAYRQNRRSLREKITNTLQSASAQAARELDLWLTERLYEARVFSSSYEVTENLLVLRRSNPESITGMEAKARLSDYLSAVQTRFRDYDAIAVTDSRGRVVAATAALDSNSLHLPPDWLDDATANETVQGIPFETGASDGPAMMIAVSLLAGDGSFLGALLVTAKLREVGAILERFTPVGLGHMYLTARDGTIIAKSLATTPPPDAPHLTTAAAAALFAREMTAVGYPTDGGLESIGVVKLAPLLGWGVVTEVTEVQAYAEVVHLRNVTILIATALIIGAGMIAYFLAVLVVRPLDRLTEGAAAVARGDLAVDLPVVSGGEMGYLTEVFNDMVARLKEGRRELDEINETLRQKNQELARLSVTDPLTGCYNRRYLMETLESETKRAQRHDQPYAILMIDVDRFKKLNDASGHLMGDAVLTRIGVILRRVIRDIDCAARYGGEEFMVLLPETSVDAALAVAERIRTEVAQETVGENDRKVSVTVSIGVAGYPSHGAASEAVISSADVALYRAKRSGRNTVVVAAPGSSRRWSGRKSSSEPS